MVARRSGSWGTAFALLLLVVLSCPAGAAIDPAEARQRLEKAGWSSELAAAIVSKVTGCQGRVVAVFDHDHTLVRADITQGDGARQPGLAQTMLQNRLYREDPDMRPPEEFKDDVFASYLHWAKIEPAEAYAWICTLYGGFSERELSALAARYYAQVVGPRIFPEMRELVQVLTALGVDVYIVSASAEPLVRAAAEHFGLPEDHLLGVKVKSRGGMILPEVAKPISFAAGKTWYIQRYAGVFPPGNILVFGDSWRTDGHMLRFGANQGGFSLLVNPPANLVPELERAGVHAFPLPSNPRLAELETEPLANGWMEAELAGARSVIPARH